MRTKLTVFAVFLSSFIVAQKHTISGYITDNQSGEPIISASVYDAVSGQGTVSNAYGFYSLTLPDNSVDLQYSFVGYAVQNHVFQLVQDTSLQITLSANVELEEITVTAAHKQFGAMSAQMGAVSVPVEQIQSMPAFLGETDVIKSLQLLPGVQGGTEGSAGMYVRGGGPDENLLLLDGVPVYNINHAMGFFSIFDADAIKNVTLYKGSFPARYGGRLSSVVDIRMNDGNMYDYHGKVSIGLISSKFHLEGPLWKGHTSFSLSGRRTYYDILAQPILALIAKQSDINRFSAGYYFWDVNAKLTHKFSDKDKLFASFYMGDDVVYTTIKESEQGSSMLIDNNKIKVRWKWGNIVAALRWNHVINSQMFLNTSVNYTQYRHNLGLDYNAKYRNYGLSGQLETQTAALSVGYNSGINDVSAKVEMDYTPSPNHNLRFGANYIFHIYRPGVNSYMRSYSSSLDDISQSIDTAYGNVPIMGHETSLYAEDDMTLGKYVKANVGLHYSTMTIDGKFYHSLQPRISMRTRIYDDLSLKIGYVYMTQYIHLLSNNNVSLPNDLWVPITANIQPMKVNQWSAGIFYDLKNWVSFSVEGYYKRMSNLLEYKDGSTYLGSSTNWDEKVCQGRGWSYGVEFLVQRSIGNTTGWIGYTWSRAFRLFDREGQELNQGRPFPAKYDRMHDVSITLAHKFSERFDISGTWVFSTGNCGTLPTHIYNGTELYKTSRLEYVGERNGYRFENYHRLDLGFNFHYYGKKVKKIYHTWSVSVYNVYNHKNPFMIFPETNFGGGYQLQKLTLFPIIPTVTYSLKF